METENPYILELPDPSNIYGPRTEFRFSVQNGGDYPLHLILPKVRLNDFEKKYILAVHRENFLHEWITHRFGMPAMRDNNGSLGSIWSMFYRFDQIMFIFCFYHQF